MIRRLALLLTILFAAPAFAGTIAITNGRVATISGPVIDGGTLIIRDGRIARVGRNVPVPPGAEVIDAGGGWVTPGLIAAYSQLGLVEIGLVASTNDSDASKSRYSAAIDVAPAINPHATPIAVTRIEGITRAAVAPDSGNDIFAGQGAIMHLGAGDRPVTHARAFQMIELGEGGARRAGGARGAMMAQLRDAFADAAAYARASGQYGSKTRHLGRADAAALARVLTGKVPAMIRANRASDILEVLALKRSYPKLRLILVEAAEGWMVADRIADARVPVIAQVIHNLPENFETLAATQSNLGRMARAGVKVAIAPVRSRAAHQVRLMPQHAGNLVAQSKVPGGTGLSHSAALAAMTQTPAAILGLSRELGTLEPGKRADVVVWSGDPIELSSAPTAIFINGKRQSLESRQTKLRDRYHPAKRSPLPKQYQR